MLVVKLNESLGSRLKKERKRLGMTQAAFAKKIGASRLAVLRNEIGERCPDANYLLACQEIGVNVLYVLNGVTNIRLDFVRMEYSIRALLEILRDLDSNVDVKTLTAAAIQFYETSPCSSFEQSQLHRENSLEISALTSERKNEHFR